MVLSGEVPDINPYRNKGRETLQHSHQVRMEIAVAAQTDRVNVAGILRELMQRATQGSKDMTFADVHEEVFSLEEFPNTTTFANRLGVSQVSHGATKKVVLGFFIHTPKPFMEIKINIGFNWLQNNKVFLRQQTLPFKHGTDLSLIGYYIMEHPHFGNAGIVIDDILHSWAESTKDPDNDDDVHRLHQMEKTGIIENGENITIPVTVERGRLNVKPPNTSKSSFTCEVWHVYVPRKHYSDANFLNDLSILDAKTLDHMIPQALVKGNNKVFYQQMTKHAKYMHEHRNITIHNVSDTNYHKTELLTEGADKHHTSMAAVLGNKESIYRIYYDPKTESINLSMAKQDYESNMHWLKQTLPNFSFGPYIKNHSSHRTTVSTRSDRYSKIFSTMSQDDGSFDPSTIASPKSQNPWKRPPPIELIFDIVDTEQFPHLPTPSATHVVSPPATTANDRSAFQDIQTIVTAAIKKQEKRFNEQLEHLKARNLELEQSLKRLTMQIEEDIEKIAEKMAQAMMGTASPFFTKTDAEKMILRQQKTQAATQNQLDQILQLLNGKNTIHLDPTPLLPPRKTPRLEEASPTMHHRQEHGTDHPMTDARHEGVESP